MPANTGTVKIEIRVDDKGTVKVKQFGDQMDKTGRKGEQSFKRTGRSVGDFNKKLATTHSNVLKLVAAFGGFMIIRSSIRWINDFMEAAGKQQQSVAGMEQAMRSMGRYTPQLRDELIGLAQGFQAVTTFGDEATIEGTKFLLTYKAITDDLLPRSIKTMLDLAALMGGDTRQAANMLGKASMGLAGELRRVGITIDENIGKSGDFAAILGEIEKQVGGQAEALARTDYGGLIQLRNLTGDAKEQFGELALKIGQAGVFDILKENLIGVTDKMKLWIEQNEALINQKVHESIDKITTAVEDIYEIYKALPDGVVGAAGAGIVGRIIFGGPAGKTIFTLVLLNAQLSKIGMGVGDIVKDIKDLKKIYDATMAGMKFDDYAGFFGGGKPSGGVGGSFGRDRIKLTITGPGKEITAEADMWAEGWAKAEEEVAKTWQQSAYGFNQLQEQIMDAEKDSWHKKIELSKRFTEALLKFEKEKTEAAVSEMEQIYNTFIDNVQTHFADTFYDIFQGQLDSFDDFLDSMKDMFLRMLAEMAAAAAMKKIVIPMATSMGSSLGLGGLFGSANNTGKTAGILGGIGGFSGLLGLIGAAGIGWTIGQTIGKMLGLGKEKDPYYKFSEGWRTTAQYTPGQGFDAISNIKHHGGGKDITNAVRQLYEQMVDQANAVLKSVPIKLQDQLEPYLESIVFRPTDYKFKFKNAEQVIQAMAQKWTAQVEEAFNAAARAAGNASFAEMLAWEDIAWQASVMGGAVSDLEVQIHNINEQFDAWIQQLTQLGSTEERLAEIEKYRQMALDGLTTSTANYARQIEGLQATLLSITTGSDSPLDAMERLALARKAIGAAMGPDMTPEDASKIQNLWMNYLRVAQEAYQRPSLEYQNIYAETTAALNSLVGWLQGMESYQHGTDYVPVTGPAILHRGERVSRPGEGASVVVNFQPSIQVDGSRDSMRASREITGEFERFMRGRGRKIVQEAVKYQ